MKLKLGKQDFDLDPLLGGDKFAELYAYVGMQEIRQTKIYDYDCKHNTASDPDGWLRMEVQPSVYFSVLKKGKDEPELDKGASKKNRDALASKAGMKHKDIVADVIKAIGPIVIEANMNPYRDKWRRKYSFDVFMQLLSVKFILRLSGAHSAGYAIVSIPRQYTLSTMKTRVCGPMHQVPLDGVVMGHINQHSEAANGALEEFDKKLEEVVEESNERMKKEAAKKGVKITPGEPKEEKKK